MLAALSAGPIVTADRGACRRVRDVSREVRVVTGLAPSPAAGTSESMKGSPVVAVVVGFFSRLRFPVLFAITAVAFVIDLVVPDLIPFADELALGLLAALLAAWRKRRTITDEEDEDDRGTSSSSS